MSHDDLKNVLHTCSFNSADCNIDHSFRCSKIRLNVGKLKCSSLTWYNSLPMCFRRNGMPQNLVTLDATQRYMGNLAVHGTPYTVQPYLPLGRGPWRHTNGLTPSRPRWLPSSEPRSSSLPRASRHPTKRTCKFSRPPGARSMQQTARCCTSEYWTKLSKSIQTTTVTGNIRGMYDGIKKALGPAQNKAPTQMHQWGSYNGQKFSG